MNKAEYNSTCKTLDILDYYKPGNTMKKITPYNPMECTGVLASNLYIDQVSTPYKSSFCIQSTAVTVLATVCFLYTLFSCYCIKIQNYLVKAKDHYRETTMRNRPNQQNIP